MKPIGIIGVFVLLFNLAACEGNELRPIASQTIPFHEGWNSFSTYLEIEGDIENVFLHTLPMLKN